MPGTGVPGTPAFGPCRWQARLLVITGPGWCWCFGRARLRSSAAPAGHVFPFNRALDYPFRYTHRDMRILRTAEDMTHEADSAGSGASCDWTAILGQAVDHAEAVLLAPSLHVRRRIPLSPQRSPAARPAARACRLSPPRPSDPAYVTTVPARRTATAPVTPGARSRADEVDRAGGQGGRAGHWPAPAPSPSRTPTLWVDTSASRTACRCSPTQVEQATPISAAVVAATAATSSAAVPGAGWRPTSPMFPLEGKNSPGGLGPWAAGGVCNSTNIARSPSPSRLGRRYGSARLGCPRHRPPVAGTVAGAATRRRKRRHRLAGVPAGPVKVHWSRAEEFQRGYLRPMAVIDVRAGLDSAGSPDRMGFSRHQRQGQRLRLPLRGSPPPSAISAGLLPHAQGPYRALSATANTFARESHIDELAYVAGADPLRFRLRHLDDERLVAVAEAAAERVRLAARSAGRRPAGLAGRAMALERSGPGHRPGEGRPGGDLRRGARRRNRPGGG